MVGVRRGAAARSDRSGPGGVAVPADKGLEEGVWREKIRQGNDRGRRRAGLSEVGPKSQPEYEFQNQVTKRDGQSQVWKSC